MRCTIPEISWHNREPVLSVDIHPVSNDFYRLASGGGDGHILIWQMSVCENGAVKQEVITDLTRHQKAVNTVRWSPSGQYLASADDDAYIIVWQLKTDNIPLLEGESEDKEIWIVHKILRGHKEDVYDMCWSMDNKKLLSGSVDNTAIIWDLNKGKIEHILADHKGFVQGVAWDPKDQFLATISTDRICRLFDISGKHVKARIHKGKLPLPPNHFLYEKESKFFHDDTFKSFFRRLEFSPDGSLLVVPSGHIQAEDCKKILNATLVFTMDNFNEPAAVLPLPQQCSTSVRFCPTAFALRRPGPEPYVRLPYRMVFAVGTDHDVILYDTQQPAPFARFHQIHYTRLTDLSWAGDGKVLVASSTDGFCALITFEAGELGQPYVKEDSDTEECPTDTSVVAEVIDKDENVDTTNKLQKEAAAEKKRSSFLKQWAQNNPKKTDGATEKKPASLADGDVVEIIDDGDAEQPREINRLIPRRINPTKVAEAVPIEEETDAKKTSIDTAKTASNIEKPDTTNKPQKVTASEKKRPNSFLKRWAQNTPKKTDAATEKKPASPEVIEIIDDDDAEQLSLDIKEQINRLLPRRIKPTTVAGVGGDDGRKATPIEVRRAPRNFDAKPIAVRRRPRQPENTNDDAGAAPVEGGTTAVDSRKSSVQTKVTSVDSKVASVDSKTTPVDSKTTPVDLKTTPVDSKTTPVDSKATSVDSKTTPVDSRSSPVDSKRTPVDSKTIPVDSKTTPVDSRSSPVDSKATSVDSKAISVDSKTTPVDSKTTPVDSKTTPVDSKRTPVDSRSSSVDSKTTPVELPNRKKLVVMISAEERREAQRAFRDVGGVAPPPTDRQGGGETAHPTSRPAGGVTPTSTKRRRPSSSSSSAKRGRGRATPPKVKVGSLVRRSLGVVTPRANPLLDFLQRRTAVEVTLDAEGEAARDGWGATGGVGVSAEGANEAEDDHTEDFCLQLEESQDGAEGVGGSPTIPPPEAGAAQKAPRRVPLITLSSPRGSRGQGGRRDAT